MIKKKMIDGFPDIYKDIHRGCVIREADGVRVVQADNLRNEKGIVHGFTTRVGGISNAPFDTLNLGLSRNEPLSHMQRNFHILADAYSLDYDTFAVVNHEHGSNVLRVDKNDCGSRLTKDALPYSDGMITNDPGITLITSHADCSAVFLYDPIKRCIGLAHAGWKGTLKRVGQQLAHKLISEFDCNPTDIIAAIGPCICFDCFEVQAELAKEFVKKFGVDEIAKPGRTGKKGKAYVDIEAVLSLQLLEAGIRKENLSIMHLCTLERKDLFYSYRRDGIDTGSMVSYMRIV